MERNPFEINAVKKAAEAQAPEDEIELTFTNFTTITKSEAATKTELEFPKLDSLSEEFSAKATIESEVAKKDTGPVRSGNKPWIEDVLQAPKTYHTVNTDPLVLEKLVAENNPSISSVEKFSPQKPLVDVPLGYSEAFKKPTVSKPAWKRWLGL